MLVRLHAASKLKAEFSTNMYQPSVLLIKSLCYPESNCFKSEATCWSVNMKRQLLQLSLPGRKETCDIFLISEGGLVIHPSYPFVVASPDSFGKYECCGKGVIEVKCPYSCKHSEINWWEDIRFSIFLEKGQERGFLFRYVVCILFQSASSAEILFCIACK